MRSTIGKVAAFLCVLLCLSILDAVIAGFRQPARVFDLLPGTSSGISGLMAEKVESTGEISYKVSSELIRLSIDSIQKGHWFGDNMWQGRIVVSPDSGEGEYSLTVSVDGIKKLKPPLNFLIRVHKDYASYRHSFKSFIKRYLDISPWILAAYFFTFVLPAFVYVFFLSVKIENQMAKQGKAVVYRVIKAYDGYEISFSLGTAHGIRTDTSLALLNEKGKPAGTVVVHNVSETDAVAKVGPGCTVKPGYTVSLAAR
ncbi:MAG: hypothetical protein KKD92_08780 [Proteobacteria bacterium]|nr:hypothetical protein [Pseudomonadota bacterium]